MPFLSVNGISKKYKNVVALDDVSFDVSSGEILALLGANGAGKSTAMKIICGLTFADSGTVTIDRHDNVSDRIAAIKNVGAVIENPCFYDKMTAFDNLKTAGIYYGITDDTTLNKTLEFVGLLECKKRKVETFSLGMKQRLGIAIALFNSPKLLILDEPTNGLDPQGIYELRELIKRLAHEQNVAVLLSSHQLFEVQNTADRVAIMDKGRIVAIKGVDELLHATGDKRVLIKVENVEDTRRILKECGYTYSQVAPDICEVSINCGLAEFNREMIMKGVAIVSTKEKEIRLEDAFMSLTAENRNTADSDNKLKNTGESTGDVEQSSEADLFESDSDQVGMTDESENRNTEADDE